MICPDDNQPCTGDHSQACAAVCRSNSRAWKLREAAAVNQFDDDDSIVRQAMVFANHLFAKDARIAALEAALRTARDDMEGWAAYAGDYFIKKHNLAGDLADIDKALEGK